MKKLLMAATVAAALVAGQASAQMYMGAGVGSSKLDNREDSWKLYGGYQFNPTWGAELGYNDLGQNRGGDMESWTLAGTGTLPLNERWSMLGKLGVASNRPHFAGSSNRTGLLVGVGVGYTLSRNVGLRVEYEDFGKLSKNNIGSNTKGNNVSVSLKYMFF
ncbi:MAG: outer membrane beta-barrel protein [Burkholderiales bacterium]|nr:outer membrane beta-barrel protein [Burkholderiales bacterium]MDP2399460.1 outer membrane beta-barrel protein [Burkholderiales bacterium]